MHLGNCKDGFVHAGFESCTSQNDMNFLIS